MILAHSHHKLTTLFVAGVGVYGEEEDGIIPNNGLVTSGGFRCISAAMSPSISELIGPSGAVIGSGRSAVGVVGGARTNLTFSEEGGSMHVGSVQDLSEEEVGVYTCRVSDETGEVVEINVGLYPTRSKKSFYTFLWYLMASMHNEEWCDAMTVELLDSFVLLTYSVLICRSSVHP